MNEVTKFSSMPLDAKYRPRRPEDLIGQDEAIRAFHEHINNDLAPAFLLHGPPGVGKTTWAEMFAMTRICENPSNGPCGTCTHCRGGRPNQLHFCGFSGASHDTVEVLKKVEELMYNVSLGNYGCFIDEVHGLQSRAADVILKEVETPRRGRYFICATTELESVRPALRSRCVIVPFRPVRPSLLFGLAQRICGEERISYEPEALDILVAQARGSARELVKGLEAVSRRGHLSREVMKSALALDWTEHLLCLADALLAGDLRGQLDAMNGWLAKPSDKARHLKEFLLYVYNFEVSTPRIRDVVNPAFHLIETEARRQIAGAFGARARAEHMPAETYWSNLLRFWLLDPALMQDDASLAIKLHEFHRLVTPADVVVSIPAPSPVPVRKREFRKRSQRASVKGDKADKESRAVLYLGLKDAEKIGEAASFMAQHYGCLINLCIDLAVTTANNLDGETAKAITRVTHELGLRIHDRDGRAARKAVHWIYRNFRQGDTLTCRLAVHVPYEYLEGAAGWIEGRDWSEGSSSRIVVKATFHNPKCRNTKARDVSRLRFHWNRIRALWAGLDPGILHWATDGTKQPLRLLLGLQRHSIEDSDPIGLKAVGVSHSLNGKVRSAAEANKMRLISAFKDAAWDHLDTGWELLEHQDRTAEIEARQEQLDRAQLIGGEGELARKRHNEELAKLNSSWPDDARLRPRTWTPWWSGEACGF